MRRFSLRDVAPLTLAIVLGACDEGEPDPTDASVSCAAPAIVCGGVCVDPTADPGHCGGCDTSCAQGELCSDGTCVIACGGGTTLCGDDCVDTDNDPDHCGDCESACTGDERCLRGTCSLVCSGGTTMCGGGCVDTDHDPNHCGDCDQACDTDEVCSDGTCGPFCTGGTIDCDGACVDTNSDEEHCGDCTTTCDYDQTCTEGGCVDICDTAATYCSGRCTDTDTDVRNCGECGTACGLGYSCVDGECMVEEEVDVLIFYDDASYTTHPAADAATALGYTVMSIFEDGDGSGGPAFTTAYAGRTWDLVIVDVSYWTIPDEVRTVTLARTDDDLPVVVSYYDLDDDTALTDGLAVSVTDCADPEPIDVAPGATPNLFNYSTTITGPLTTELAYSDNGDYLTPTDGGSLLLVGSEPTEGQGAVTNARSAIVLGFITAHYRDVNVDADGTTDLEELFTNILEWYADGTP